MERRGPGPIAWVIAGIVVLMVGGMVATITISNHYDVPGGYIPREERTSPR